MRELSFVFILFSWTITSAQEYLVQHYTIHDGLVNDEVFCFAQDTSGIIWIGTDNGLSSFDGQSFTNYFREDGLPGKSITSLLLDKKGQLWAGGYSKGISIRKQQGFETRWELVKSYKAGVDVLEFDGKFWETRGNTLSILDSTGSHTMLTKEENTAPELSRFYQSPSKLNIALSPDQQKLWIGSTMGLTALGKDMETISVLPPDLRPRAVSEIVHLDDGSTLLGGSGIVRRIRGNEVERIYELGLEDTFRVHRILILGEEAWIAAEGFGLLSLNLSTGNITRQKDLLGIETDVIHSLFLDRNNNIWMGTRGNGVYCLQPTFLQNHKLDGISCNTDFTSINSLRNGDLAIMVSGGMIMRHPNGVFEQCFCNPSTNNFGLLTHQDRPVILSTLLQHEPPGVRILKSSAACELQENEILYQKDNGNTGDLESLIRATFNGDSWVDKNVITLDIPFQGSQIRHIFLDSTGYFWIGNHQDSLWMITTPEEQVLDQDIHVGTRGYQLTQLQKIIVDPEGTIWVCGRRAVWKKEKEDTTFSTYLENSVFYEMSMQKDGTIWIADEEGLISIRNGKSQSYGLNGYLGLGQINAMHIPGGGDTLWLASREGLFSTSLSVIEARLLPEIRPLFSHILVNQQPLSGDLISLQLGENLQVGMRAAVFFSGLAPRYRYRIFDGAWVEVQSSSISLPTSKVGQIRGEIAAALPGGNWGAPLVIEYEVRPGFWLSPFTWLGFAILIILVAFGIARFQIGKVRRREIKEREIQKEFHRLEQQAFSAMLNPHFIFNTINSIQQELLEEDPMLAHRHLSKFAKLIRKNMDLSTRSTVSLKEELERLSLYLEMEKLRLGEKIETIIQVAPQIPLAEVEIPSMILQPYVENAIWHGILLSGRKGTVTVCVGFTDADQIQIQIKDDGIGIEVAKTKIRSSDHISLGMSITEARIVSFHDETSVVAEQINDENGNSEGTLVTIVIPRKIQLG